MRVAFSSAVLVLSAVACSLWLFGPLPALLHDSMPTPAWGAAGFLLPMIWAIWQLVDATQSTNSQDTATQQYDDLSIVQLRTDEEGMICEISPELAAFFERYDDELQGASLAQILETAQKPAPPSLDSVLQIVAASADITMVLDSKLNIRHANRKAIGALGLGSDYQSTGVYKLVSEEYQSDFMLVVKEITQGKKSANLDRFRLRPLGNKTVDAQIVQVLPSPYAHYLLTIKTDENRGSALDNSASGRFSEVFHASPDAILIIRASDGIVSDFNAGFTRLLGYQREDAIGESTEALNLWHNSLDGDTVGNRLRAEHEVTDYETTLRTSTGVLVHVEISLRYVEIDNELCVLCIGRDITKRISAEAALIESEEKFEKIFNQSPDGIMILRQSDTVVTDINQEILNRGGFARKDIVGKSLMDLPFGISESEVSDIAGELNQTGLAANREVKILAPDGEVIPHLVSAVALDLSGETHILILSKDISRQRADEERLKRSESRFRGIFENAPIGILLVDMQGRIFQANHTAANLLAYDQHHMYGIHISRLVPSEDRRALKESLNALEFKEPSHRSERRLICQNGLEVWSTFNVALQTSSSGEGLYHIVQIADITDLKHSQQRMEQMAFYDTLTKLANRRLFQDRLNQAIERSVRSQTTSALLYLDLDNFKRVNDTLGHQVGDNLLQEIGQRLMDCVRRQDTVGRTGGDEFCVLLNDIDSPRDAGNIAAKILNHMREPITISGHPLIVTSSIGITIVPGDGLDPNVLMRNADLAMYKAKERGKNNFQYYSEDLNVNAVKRLRTEFEMRQALENEEFELYYQPKIAIDSGKVVGVESLIRWHHPERGFLAPDEFIGIAEDTGIISEIGSWVIQSACRAGAHLNQHFDRHLQVAINISPRQFRDPNLITTVRQSLRETGLSADQIEIEITETMLMEDISAAQIAVERFQEIGVKLAIDDFGTGYSSLNYLKKFPINTVKVDRSFVMDIPDNLDDMAITSAVIAMAHELKMEVVAEGVETPDQFDFLATHNCEYAQGWLFSKPIPLPELIEYVKKSDQELIQAHRA